MTPRQVRAALRKDFASTGFHEDGARFIREEPDLVHGVEITAVRRLPNCIQILHDVVLKSDQRVVLTQEIVSHGFNSAYPRIWSADGVDATLVLDQVSALCRAFQSKVDVDHFLFDRGYADEVLPQADGVRSGKTFSLSASEAKRAIQVLAHEVLSTDFSLTAQFETFDLWCSRHAEQGFFHGAYVESNDSRTLGHIVLMALSSTLVTGGVASDEAMRTLMTAEKATLFVEGRPLLVPLNSRDPVNVEAIRQALLSHMRQHPAYAVRR